MTKERTNGCDITRQQNLFEDKPDARQGDAKVKPSRFRPTYRALSADEIALHNAIKGRAEDIEKLINATGEGRYKALAITSLEESVMWAVKQLTS